MLRDPETIRRMKKKIDETDFPIDAFLGFFIKSEPTPKYKPSMNPKNKALIKENKKILHSLESNQVNAFLDKMCEINLKTQGSIDASFGIPRSKKVNKMDITNTESLARISILDSTSLLIDRMMLGDDHINRSIDFNRMPWCKELKSMYDEIDDERESAIKRAVKKFKKMEKTFEESFEEEKGKILDELQELSGDSGYKERKEQSLESLTQIYT